MKKKDKNHKQKHKKVPHFWWDFHWHNNNDIQNRYMDSVIVQIDNDDYNVEGGVIAVFNCENMTINVENAEQLIKDLNAGRISIKECIRKYT